MSDPRYYKDRSSGDRLISITSCLPYEGEDFVPHSAKVRGTIVHRATALEDLGILDYSTVDPAIEPYMAAYNKFRRATSFEPVIIERPCRSHLYGYAGTPDRAGWICPPGIGPTDDRHYKAPVVIELKSGPPKKPCTWGLQISGQEQAIKETFGESHFPGVNLFLRYAVQLNPDGTFIVHPYTGREDFQIFLSFLNTKRWTLKNS